MYRVTDSALRPVSTGVGKRDNQVFLCHLWLTVRKDNDSDSDQSDKEGDDKVKDGACIYSLNSGDLLYVEGGEVNSFQCFFLPFIYMYFCNNVGNNLKHQNLV